MSCSRNFGVSPVSRHFLLKKISRNMRNNNIPWKKCLDQGILSFFLFLELLIAKNVKKHEKQQSPLNKWLSQGILSFLLFLDITLYSKVSRNRKTTKSLDFLNFLQFLHNLTKPSAAGTRQGIRSVPSRHEAWAVYPLEVYYPDEPKYFLKPHDTQYPLTHWTLTHHLHRTDPTSPAYGLLSLVQFTLSSFYMEWVTFAKISLLP